ncbi:PREDICTED: uncharacterized protein LOC104743540 [Camelina sativa]|uniref:Uncharacterized protein LOC104743540 n=1 Tax=Camelina sativa TaxID=90675 RepID=A0ABM0VY62_CAMSA|nr:PREDICTED: uncharacterized protein LOC104743540 [Camelina sativa]
MARILLGRYCHSTPFLRSVPPTNTSHGWRGICIGKDLLEKQLSKVIGNGHQTSLWSEPWLSLETALAPMGPPTKETQFDTVATLISPTTKHWDREKIRQVLSELEQTILEIKVSTKGAEDTFVWLPTKNGVYSTKSGYYESIKKESLATLQCPLAISNFNWLGEVWNIQSSPKNKLLLWKAMKGALPTGENLRKRNIMTETRCPFCGEMETSEHLFIR